MTGQTRHNRTVSFDPLALLLDASLEGELDLVKKTACEVSDLVLPMTRVSLPCITLSAPVISRSSNSSFFSAAM